ncbi:MAG TPA: hypothetical protein VN238_19450, partial [Solirubrobacteraceae bacterium]|nr:hypothetical protein [Solirubrobacteraceae bacterium]
APEPGELIDAVRARCAGVTGLEPGTLEPRAGELRTAEDESLSYVHTDDAVTADTFGVVATNEAGGVPLEVDFRTVELAPTCTFGSRGGWENSARSPVRVKGPRLLDVRCADANGDGAKLEVVQQGALGKVKLDGGEAIYVPREPLPTAPAVDTVKVRALSGDDADAGATRTLHLMVGEGLNTPPVCAPVAIPQPELGDVTFPHLAFCEDADGDGIAYEVKQQPHHGTVDLEQDEAGRGRLTYTKDPASTATFDVVRLTADDGVGGKADVLVGIGRDPGGACTVSSPVFLDPGATARARVTCTGPWGTPLYARAAGEPKAGHAEVGADGLVTYRAGQASGRFTVGVEWSPDPSFSTGVQTYEATFQVLPGASRALRTTGERPGAERVPLPSSVRGVADAERLADMLTVTPGARTRTKAVAKDGALTGPTLTPDFDGTAAVAATLADGTEIGRADAKLKAGMSTVLGIPLNDAAIKPLRRAKRRTEVRLRITARDRTGAARTVRARIVLKP